MTTGWKLAIGGMVVAGTTAYMAYLGAATSWQYYVTVDECLADADAIGGARVRVSGKIAPGSLRISSDRSEADFFLEGTEAALRVIASGPVPDNLAEAVDVVAEGRLDNAGVLKAEKVLTRCAGKYEPETSSPTSEESIRTARKGDG